MPGPMVYPPRTVAEAKQETRDLVRYHNAQIQTQVHNLRVAFDSNNQEMIDLMLGDVRERCTMLNTSIERYVLARQLRD